MPLPYATVKPLSATGDQFDVNGVLVLVLHAVRIGSKWTFKLYLDGPPAAALKTVYGELTASIPYEPDPNDADFRENSGFRDSALESALFWMVTETRSRQWRLATMADQTEIISDQDRSTLIITKLVLVNEHFVPKSGFLMLDEMITGTATDPAVETTQGE